MDTPEYWHWLIGISLGFILLEWFWPRRDEPGSPARGASWFTIFQRPGWLRDLAFLAMNGHFFGLVVWELGEWLASVGWAFQTDSPFATTWPVWVQFLAVLLVRDFVQWATHVCLHKIPFLWEFHKVHHSIPRLDWAANFHYHWAENLVYTATQAVPMALLGVPHDVAIWVYIAGTAWGHCNHSAIPLRLGPMGYILNSPRMHLWHHDATAEGGVSKNYGIVLSLWDWIFRTAYWPRDRDPDRLGFPGDTQMPGSLGGQLLWPLSRLSPLRKPLSSKPDTTP